jgi:hypothetical protein
VAQRRGFREYLAGLLAPRERNKTLTALAGAEPVTGAQHPAVQRLQFFLSESRGDADQVNARRLELLLADPATAPHGGEGIWSLLKRSMANFAAADLNGPVRIIKRKLKKIQYRPHLIDGCLAATRLTIEPW